MKTLILAAARGYTVQDLMPWVRSLKESGYAGKTVVLLYDRNPELAEYLGSNSIMVWCPVYYGLTNIATQRFSDYITTLKQDYLKDITHIIHTDIRDVVFQSNPEKWLVDNLKDHKILASAEGIKYLHEDWNGEGLQYHYGDKIFKSMSQDETLCSGIIAGEKEALIELFQTIFELTFYSRELDGFIDQHPYNLAIRKIFNKITLIPSADEPWVANLGTLIAIPYNTPLWSSGPRTGNLSYERFRTGTFTENLLVSLPVMINDQVCTPAGVPYAIVHQYNRYEPWNKILIDKFSVPYQKKTQEKLKVGFYMWAYQNVENVDYIFKALRSSHPESEIVLSSDNGADFSEMAKTYNVMSYIHAIESHGYPQTTERYGWTAENAKLWFERFYQACKTMKSDYVMMMDEDVLVKDGFWYPEVDLFMTPGIQNPIPPAGMAWIKERGGRTDYPYYNFGGGSLIKRTAFIEAYTKHKDSFFEKYEEIYQDSMAKGYMGWGWNDCMICSVMWANNANFNNELPVSETGIEEDPQPIIHKFKKFYTKLNNVS